MNVCRRPKIIMFPGEFNIEKMRSSNDIKVAEFIIPKNHYYNHKFKYKLSGNIPINLENELKKVFNNIKKKHLRFIN